MTLMRLSLMVFAAAVIVTAIALVDARHTNRKEFAELQQLRQQRDSLNVEWGKLQLEESAWATHARIEQTARKSLGMAMPRNSQIVVIKR